MKLASDIAARDSEQPASPLVGSWRVTAVRGMGGVAADALEIYDPDPVGRTFVFANDIAALCTGGAFWLFDANYDRSGGGTVDLGVVVRGDTVYRGTYKVSDNRATMWINPMNTPRPGHADGNPTNGGFVLELERNPGPIGFDLDSWMTF